MNQRFRGAWHFSHNIASFLKAIFLTFKCFQISDVHKKLLSFFCVTLEEVGRCQIDKFVRLMEMAGAINSDLFGTRMGRILDWCRKCLSWIDAEAEFSWEWLLLFSVIWTLMMWNGRGNVKRRLWSKVPRAVQLRQVSVEEEGAIFRTVLHTMSHSSSTREFAENQCQVPLFERCALKTWSERTKLYWERNKSQDACWPEN